MAINLAPSSSDAHHMAGMYHGYAGNFRKAVIYEERAQQLSPIERNESMVDEAVRDFISEILPRHAILPPGS